MTVNALVTSLIVFRIFKVYWEVKLTSDNQTLSTGGNKVRTLLFVIIESGMILLSLQVARLVSLIVGTAAATKTFCVIVGAHNIFNVITTLAIAIYFTDKMGLSRV